MHAVSFTYPGEPQNQPTPAPEQKPKVNVALTEEIDPPTPERKTSGELPRWKVRRDPPGRPQVTQDPDSYRISGNPRWRPVNVYNDGRKTFVVMTEEMTKTEAAAMLVLRRNNYLFGFDKVLANYGVLGTSERKVRLSHRQRLLRRCTSFSWSTIGLRNGRSSGYWQQTCEKFTLAYCTQC
jgi:hypothetical protein